MANYILSTFSVATPPIRSLFMDYLGHSIAGGANNNGIYYSQNNGITWLQSNKQTGNIYSVFMDQNGNAIAGSDTSIYYSGNYGQTWLQTSVPVQTQGNINSVFMDQNGNAIAASNVGIYYSGNYGETWSLNYFGSFRSGSLFMAQNGNAIAGSSTGISYSGNYGENWSLRLSANIYSVFMDESGNAIASGADNNGIYYSQNYGITWLQSNLFTGSFVPVFMDRNGNAIAGGGNNNGIYYSQNYGQNWIQSNKSFATYPYVFMDQNGNATASSGNGIIYSSDYGHNWYNTNVLSTPINALFMNRAGNQMNRLAAGTATYYYTELVCFKEGTHILTDKGYLLIQDLKKGDLVKTVNDFIPIHAIGKREIYHPAAQNRDKDQLYKCSPEHFPVFEDLVITGCHSILVDEFKEGEREKTIEINGDAYVTENKYRLPACVDQRTTVYETAGTYTIYHFALENDDIYNNYGVYANGLLVETCSKINLKELSNMTIK